jgi:hypothetical protein
MNVEGSAMCDLGGCEESGAESAEKEMHFMDYAVVTFDEFNGDEDNT